MSMKYVIGLIGIVLMAMIAAPALAGGYAAVPVPTPGPGMVHIYVQSGYPSDVIIQNVTAVNGMFDGVLLPDQASALVPVGTSQTLAYGDDHTVQLPDGAYLITLVTGSGMIPEYRYVVVQAGYTKTVGFTGEIMSYGSEDVPATVITIVNAQYGAELGAPHEETRIVTPAYDENVYTIVNYGQYTGYAKKVSFGNYDFKIGNGKYDIVNHASYDTVKYLKTTVHHDAVTTTVMVPTLGNTVDVTAAVQTLVNEKHTKLVFNNAPNPGGIFAEDGTTLLFTIADPDYGIYKTATITYTINGGAEKTVTAGEGNVITIS